MTLHLLVKRILRLDPDMQPYLCNSKDGEDLIRCRLLKGQSIDFYSDVGVQHSVHFSNTYLFYQHGWRGINIECGLAGTSNKPVYHRFNEPALNSLDANEDKLNNRLPYQKIETIEVAVKRLGALLATYMPSDQQINFFADEEGKDGKVLHSNDWQRFRPQFVLAETLGTDMLHLMNYPAVRMMTDVGYTPVSKDYNTTFLVRQGPNCVA